MENTKVVTPLKESSIQGEDRLDLAEDAVKLLKDLRKEHDHAEGGGTFSCTVYDTAWLAMITTVIDERKVWLFPSCFRYVLDSQQPDGAWESYATSIDGIMNTMAALLSLYRHRDCPLQLGHTMPLDIDARITRAKTALQGRLYSWDVGATMHVGFELVIPTLLNLLRENGLVLEFPEQQLLLKLYEQKMSRFDPALLYQENPVSALHSLEAFIGKVDFDRLRHQVKMGSMMASPASTAVYLIHSTTWDLRAEHYLCRVESEGEGKGSGGIPSAFPSTYFEIIWVLSTLLHGGFSEEELGQEMCTTFAKLLESSLRSGGGLLGFAPNVVADLDDTAQAITTLNMLNRPASADSMIMEYEAEEHFKTYAFERNPSFSANCNALNALLSVESRLQDYRAQIEKVLRFLCRSWWEAERNINDKWNLSPWYPTMLMSQALMRFLRLWDQGKIPSFPGDDVLIQDLCVMLFQALSRLLQGQCEDGSWANGQVEPSAYATLALIDLACLPVTSTLQVRLSSAIEKGRKFLSNKFDEQRGDYIWIEKVTYRLRMLHQAYILAALKAPIPTHSFHGRTCGTLPLPSNKIAKFAAFYLRLPLFARAPAWLLEASLIEGYLFLPQLQRIRLGIFPRKEMEEDRYFEYIPFTWTVSNNIEKAYFPAIFMREMMTLSFLNYQADEYMETVFSKRFEGRYIEARQLINALFDDCGPSTHGSSTAQEHDPGLTLNIDPEENGFSHDLRDVGIPSDDMGQQTNGSAMSQRHGRSANGTGIAKTKDPTTEDSKIYQTLQRFINHSISHHLVETASDHDKSRLRQELRTFLLAHVEQIEDNRRLSSQGSLEDRIVVFQSPRSTFFDWVRRTSSDHTSCPYSFAFAACLLDNGQDLFPTSNEKYLGQAACRHLATLCRMYNDFGSLARDRLEQNLNSLNFPEFHDANRLDSEEVLKASLFDLAAYERKCLEITLDELETLTDERVMRFMRTFVNVTDLYGQIYVEKDIASRVK